MDSSSQEMVNSQDMFDRLPDEIVRAIFNQLRDARSLCSSMAVCKRFRSIAPQVDCVFLPIPKKKSVVRESDLENRRSSLKDLVVRALAKPFHIISQAIKSKAKGDDKDLDFYSHSIPNEILKSFEEIRALHIRLPCHENSKQSSKRSKKSTSTTFLKWKAEFGTELQSCVILGCKSWKENSEDLGEESRVMGEDELKLRIVWTISCLIAASARHYLIEETVKGLKTVENVVVSDESEQGRVCMTKEQVAEMRGKEDEHHRSRVPALRMKMWYLEKMEMPGSGKVMEGATLVVIRPAAAEVSRSDGDMVADAFGVGNEVGEAAGKLMVAKKCYVLEMNSF